LLSTIIISVMTVRATPELAMRVSRAEAVARQLESEIIGGLEPGVRIGTKEDLRLRFGVAVATVNEAVRLLEMRGLIEARPGPGGGIFVARPAARVALTHLVLGFKTGGEMHGDYLKVRDALEPLVCQDAAEHHRADDIRALRKIVDHMAEHVDDPAVYFKFNWALHRRIARISRNTPLRSIYLTLTDYLEANLDHAQYVDFDGVANLAVHRALIDAIDAGVGPELTLAIEHHAPRLRRQA
ncbi:MAG: GntR family transcriptional regulator, transcriptional repressor for pyruvate dehydrogenase complex, partial [Gaiellales bacterium]|nr:GntR family transcriptional regulator, transcriptional repressor for pyruvate dehydrogenase complex [Gaiellales bacterium]